MSVLKRNANNSTSNIIGRSYKQLLLSYFSSGKKINKTINLKALLKQLLKARKIISVTDENKAIYICQV